MTAFTHSLLRYLNLEKMYLDIILEIIKKVLQNYLPKNTG